MTGKHIWTALDLNRPKGNESQRQLFKALSGMNVTEDLYEEDVYLKQFQELDPEDAEDIEKVIRGTGGTIRQETICGYLGKISEK